MLENNHRLQTVAAQWCNQLPVTTIFMELLFNSELYQSIKLAVFARLAVPMRDLNPKAQGLHSEYEKF
jgi:hypothetical protein